MPTHTIAHKSQHPIRIEPYCISILLSGSLTNPLYSLCNHVYHQHISTEHIVKQVKLPKYH